MNFERVKFKNLAFDLFDLEQSSEISPGSQIFSLNAEQFVMAQDDPELRYIIENSELIIPDGAGIVLGAKFFTNLDKNQKKQIKKVAGIDLARKLVEEKQKIAILGSTEEIISILKEKFSEKIVFAHHGFINLEKEEEIAHEISKLEPDLLLVGMGSPRQEKFIYRHKCLLANTICMGVGGSLDVFSGLQKRAPKIFIALHLEWFFRMIREPFRLKRILLRIPRYLFFLFRN